MCSCSPLISNQLKFLNKPPISPFPRTSNTKVPAFDHFRRSSSSLRVINSIKTTTASGNGDPESSDSSKGLSDLDFLGLKRELEDEERGLERFDEGEELVAVESEDEDGSGGEVVGRRSRTSGKQMMRRSSLIAKEVISMRSACRLGFVSQIWVDTRPWLVVVVEVRPSILSGENDKFLLEDICQIGDVMLIEDETVAAEGDVNMVGLDTLVGYSVVTPDRYNVGKVRDINFNINSGAVESLELDPFGISIIPATLVSTYSLAIEDILEIKSDKIVVHDGAVSRIQRLSKGFWDTQSSRYSVEDIEEFPAFQRRRVWDRTRSSGRRRTHSKHRDVEDWDLPLEY